MVFRGPAIRRRVRGMESLDDPKLGQTQHIVVSHLQLGVKEVALLGCCVAQAKSWFAVTVRLPP